MGPQQRNLLTPLTPEEEAQQRAEQAKRRDELRVLMKTLHAEVPGGVENKEGRRKWQRANWKRRGRVKRNDQAITAATLRRDWRARRHRRAEARTGHLHRIWQILFAVRPNSAPTARGDAPQPAA